MKNLRSFPQINQPGRRLQGSGQGMSCIFTRKLAAGPGER